MTIDDVLSLRSTWYKEKASMSSTLRTATHLVPEDPLDVSNVLLLDLVRMPRSHPDAHAEALSSSSSEIRRLRTALRDGRLRKRPVRAIEMATTATTTSSSTAVVVGDTSCLRSADAKSMLSPLYGLEDDELRLVGSYLKRVDWIEDRRRQREEEGVSGHVWANRDDMRGEGGDSETYRVRQEMFATLSRRK